MRLTFTLMGLLLLTLLPARAGHSPPKVTLRIHVQTAGEGQSTLEVAQIRVPPAGDTILIRAIPEVSEIQLVGAEQDAVGLHLQFNHTGTVDLNAATAQNQGRLLVVIIDGNVVYAPTIDTQINDGQLTIPHQIPNEVVQLLQQVAAQNIRKANKS
jgi:preprotein translocase subunit SecD